MNDACGVDVLMNRLASQHALNYVLVVYFPFKMTERYLQLFPPRLLADDDDDDVADDEEGE